MFGEVLASHERLTEYAGAEVPVPVTVTCVDGVSASLVKVRIPLTDPVAEGVKVTVNGTLWPAGTVTGNESPLTVNSGLLLLTAVTVTLSLLAFKLPEAFPLFPTATLPTGIGLGVIVSCPVAVLVPAPDSVMVKVGFDALEVMVTLPLAFPEVAGVNLTLKVAVCPAASVTGALIPLRVNPVPVTAA